MASSSAATESGKMDVEESNKVVAASGTQTSVAVSVHPLVIMNVSEHWTRMRAQNNNTAMQVFGALLGKQHGRNLELMNSFEVRWDIVAGHAVLDLEFFHTREAQYKEVFTELDFLGWYTTGDEGPTSADVAMHRQICELNESPVLLKLNPAVRTSEKLPLEVYESVIDMVRGEAFLQFVALPWTLATEEAERIGVDHVARISAANTGTESAATKQLLAQHGAVKMLHGRLQLLVEYLKAVEAGTLPRNEEVFRDVATLCHRLPVMDGDRFKDEFQNQCSDIKLTAYLGSLTKICGSVNQLVGKLNVLADRQGTGGVRRGRGLLL
uniref:COP9 signalosome complex subunit 6 n=2 Tax=Plectus sambesii TaxID=2011161 RepID=A0A914WHQ3_9BILA